MKAFFRLLCDLVLPSPAACWEGPAQTARGFLHSFRVLVSGDGPCFQGPLINHLDRLILPPKDYIHVCEVPACLSLWPLHGDVNVNQPNIEGESQDTLQRGFLYRMRVLICSVSVSPT